MGIVDELWEVLHGPNAFRNFDILIAGSIIGMSKSWLKLSKEEKEREAITAVGVTILDSIINATPEERRYVMGLVTKRVDKKVKELSG